MSLFKLGQFLLHGGEMTNFKIDCDVLDQQDWMALAYIIKNRVSRFGAVLGVPRGGLQLQQALEQYKTNRETDALLIVDDVYTTGMSMRKTYQKMAKEWQGPILGVAVFARGPIKEPWVQALFTLDLDRQSATNLQADLRIGTFENASLRERMRDQVWQQSHHNLIREDETRKENS